MKENDFRKTLQILIQLDAESLFLIDSGAKLLLARQSMDRGCSNRTFALSNEINDLEKDNIHIKEAI